MSEWREGHEQTTKSAGPVRGWVKGVLNFLLWWVSMCRETCCPEWRSPPEWGLRNWVRYLGWSGGIVDQRKKMMRTVHQSLQAWFGVLLQELNAEKSASSRCQELWWEASKARLKRDLHRDTEGMGIYGSNRSSDKGVKEETRERLALSWLQH